MPLLRYKTGDLVRLSRIPRNCFCKRTFPVVISILGRDCDVVITPEGRAITALYVALDRTPGITFGQIIQEERNRLLVKVAYSSRELRHYDSVLINNLRDFVVDSLEIEIKHVDPEEVRSCIANKHKVIISKIFNPGIFT
jgi:phenylacetate-CoA ligase